MRLDQKIHILGAHIYLCLLPRSKIQPVGTERTQSAHSDQCSGKKALDPRKCVAYLRNMKHMDEQKALATNEAHLGAHLRRLREAKATEDAAFSLRKVAQRCEITPAYLSRVERGEVAPPGEETLLRLARDLGDDPDVVLALAGKISGDLRAAILARPQLFAELIRAARTMPDHAVLHLVRDVRDGTW